MYTYSKRACKNVETDKDKNGQTCLGMSEEHVYRAEQGHSEAGRGYFTVWVRC